MLESVSQLFGSLPTRKETDFDVQGHLQKEAFLREQLRMEKRNSRDELSRLQKLNHEIKSESRMVLKRLKNRLDELERENMHYKAIDRSLQRIDQKEVRCTDNIIASMDDEVVTERALESALEREEVDQYCDVDDTFPAKQKEATPVRQIQAEDNEHCKEDHSMSPLLIADSIISSLTNDMPTAPAPAPTLERRPSLVKELVSKIEGNGKKPKASAKKSRSLSQRAMQQQENLLNMLPTGAAASELKNQKAMSVYVQDEMVSSNDPSPLSSSSSSSSAAKRLVVICIQLLSSYH